MSSVVPKGEFPAKPNVDICVFELSLASAKACLYLDNVFTELTRDELGMEQSRMWLQDKHRL